MPLCDSSNHEDADECPEFSDRGFRDPCTPSFDDNDGSLVISLYKPLVFDDLSADEVETPQDIEVLQPALLVMLDPRYLEVSSTPYHKFVETTEAPHHSLVYIEDQSSS